MHTLQRGRAGMTRPVGIERVLYNLHRRVCMFSLRHTSSQTRRWSEILWLVLAICGFGGLILLHLCFVYRPNIANVSTQCLLSIPGFVHDADVTHIVLLHRPLVEHNGTSTAANVSDCPVSRVIIHEPNEPIPAIRFHRHRDVLHDFPDRDGYQSPYDNNSDTCDWSTWSRETDGVLHIAGETQYSYSGNRAYLQLAPDDELRKYLKTQYVIVSPTDMECFGEPFLQQILWNVVGTDTVIVNWILAVVNSPAKLHSIARHQRTIYGSSDGDGDAEDDSKLAKGGPFIYHARSHRIHTAFVWERDSLNVAQRIMLLVQTAFLFVSTTTMVSFTLRETQERMLEFTQELNRRVQGREPVQKLVSLHLLQNLIFIPIMVGMMFFLVEFYGGDKFLAFMVMSIMWIAEVFSVISLRSIQGITFFPRIFFLLFCLFHVYYFAYPFGFGYTALGTISCFILHSMLFFWHRYELPAVAWGLVDAHRPRMGTSSSDTSQE